MAAQGKHQHKRHKMNQAPVTLEELQLGKPLPWNLYDREGNRLASENEVIETPQQLQMLLAHQPCRQADNDETTRRLPGNSDSDNTVYPFEAMKLKVGDRLQMQLPELLSSERVIVKLIGYVNQLSLLVTPPREANGLRIKLLENDPVVIRVFTSQNAFGFQTSVSKIINVPFEYVHLSFPKEVKGMVIRKAPRVRTKIICSVATQQAHDQKSSGIITNLSCSGALLDSTQPIAAKGETIHLSFRINLHAIDTLLQVSAVVRSQFSDEDGSAPNGRKLYHHGLEFVDLQPNDTLVLQSMIYHRIVEQPHTVM